MNGTGGVWHVRLENGETYDASLRGRLKIEKDDSLKLAVGDNVLVEKDDRGEAWVICEILSRTSALSRREPGGRSGERIVAANIDQVVIVFAAANPEPHRRMLDRFLVIAEGNDLKARIIINKMDLVNLEETRGAFGDYEKAGYPVHYTSTKINIGIAELHNVLIGSTSALSGPSGVGKSSLLNTMYPGLGLRVGEISHSVNKGRHTTVGATLHPLPDGGYVVDTPGLREVGMWGLPPENLDACFPELREYLGECRFGDCAHDAEPGCAVREGVEKGLISRDRYDSYLKLYGELSETETRRVQQKNYEKYRKMETKKPRR